MDKMEYESSTMNIWRQPSMQAGSGDVTSTVMDYAMVESMLSLSTGDATRNLQESEATSWSGERKLLQNGRGGRDN